MLIEAFVVGLVALHARPRARPRPGHRLKALFGAFGLDLPGVGLVVEPRTVIVAFAVGVLVTVLAAYLPARRAAPMPPVAAMRDEVALPTRSLRVRTGVGIVLAALALLAARAALATTDDVQRSASSPGCPRSLRCWARWPWPRSWHAARCWCSAAPFARSSVGRLARENGRRNPRRTAATAGALAIGLALMTAVGVIAASTKASVNQVVDDTVGADLIVAGAKFQPFAPQVYQAVRDIPGASVVTYSRAIVAELAGQRYPVLGVEPTKFDKVFKVTMAQGSFADLSLGTALVDKDTAAATGLKLGDTAKVSFLNGPGTLRIAGIYETSGIAQGFIVSLPTLASAGSLERDSAVYLRLAPDADAAAVRDVLQQRLAGFPSVQVVDRTDLKDQIDSQFDRVFGFVYALLALAVVVAFLGIVNTLALSVHERRREVGLLRAVGTGRGQLRAMVILESVLIAVLGGLVGVALGVAYGALLQRSLASQGVSTLAVPVGQLALFIAAALVGGFVAALWPAETAARMNVLRAIATE